MPEADEWQGFEGRLADSVGPVEKNLILYPGWNLFSLSVEPSDTDISEVLGAISGQYTEVWAFDASSQQYIGYVPGEEITDLSELHAGRGYLIRMSSPAVLSVSGERVTDSMPLIPGSNLVGCPSEFQMPVQDAFASISGKLNSVWSLDATSGKWRHFHFEGPIFLNDLSHVEPGKAYWVDMETDGVLEHANTEAKVYFHHPDHLGSSSVVTNMDGELVGRTEFYPFGRPLYEESDNFYEAYKYTGKELDAESSLMYYGARYYDAVVGRFVSVDPLYAEVDGLNDEKLRKFLGNPQRVNICAYVLNNPVLRIDTTGNDDGVYLLDCLNEEEKKQYIDDTYKGVIASYVKKDLQSAYILCKEILSVDPENKKAKTALYKIISKEYDLKNRRSRNRSKSYAY